MSGESSEERVLFKSLMYYSLTATWGGVRVWTPSWHKGAVYLTNKNIWFECENDRWISIPLHKIVDIDKPTGSIRGCPVPGLTLSINYKVSPDKVAGVFLTGPEIILKSLRDFLLPIIREAVMVKEDETIIELKILSLIQSKVRDVEKISFLLGITKDQVVNYMIGLYKKGLVDDTGKLTQKGNETLHLLKIKRER